MEYAGLKALRANNVDKKPTYECPNCKCKRYSPCGCMKKQEKKPEVSE